MKYAHNSLIKRSMIDTQLAVARQLHMTKGVRVAASYMHRLGWTFESALYWLLDTSERFEEEGEMNTESNIPVSLLAHKDQQNLALAVAWLG
jgi:hypothetical protein